MIKSIEQGRAAGAGTLLYSWFCRDDSLRLLQTAFVLLLVSRKGSLAQMRSIFGHPKNGITVMTTVVGWISTIDCKRDNRLFFSAEWQESGFLVLLHWP